MSTTHTEVTVVIPYYEQPDALARLLAALDCQRDAPPFEVVIADDGSGVAPVPSGGLSYPVRVVHQEDRGFRAAAARNLGAASAAGEALVFCDGDMLPTPRWLAALTGPLRSGEADLTVGRRRHVESVDVDPSGVAAWVEDPVAAGAAVLGEPRWLTEGYRHTDDLRRPDGDRWRYVISAHLGLTRRLFDGLGGFDEDFRRYGGEDWDLGYRAVNCGAELRHVPGALAWHDGPDWSGRGGDAGGKLLERLELAARIPRPGARPPCWRNGAPLAVVRAADADPTNPQWAACLASVLAADGAVALDLAGCSDADRPRWLRGGARADRPLNARDRQRLRVTVEIRSPVLLEPDAPDRLARLTDVDASPAVCVAGPDGTTLLTATSTWATHPVSRYTGSMLAEPVGGVEVGVRPVAHADLELPDCW